MDADEVVEGDEADVNDGIQKLQLKVKGLEGTK